MDYNVWWIIADGKGCKLKVALHLSPLVVNTVRKFGTAHSTSSTRTNAYISVKVGDCEGESEVGLPPFKKGIYEGTLEDCQDLFQTFSIIFTCKIKTSLICWSSSMAMTQILKESVNKTEGKGALSLQVALKEEEHFESHVCAELLSSLDMCKDYASFPRSAYALFETAIIKCECQISHISISSALGLDAYDEKAKCFYTIGITDDIEQLHENIKFGKSNTSYLKLKVGQEHEKLKHVFKVLESEGLLSERKKTIAIDANCSWSCQEAMEFLDAMKEYLRFIYMIEQPFPVDMPFNVSDEQSGWKAFKQVCSQSQISIYADESMRTSSDLEYLLPYCHGVNLKLEKTGGYREAVKAGELCHRMGLRVWLGCMVGSALNCNTIVEILSLCDGSVDLDGFLLVDSSCQPWEPNFRLTSVQDASSGDLHGCIKINSFI